MPDHAGEILIALVSVIFTAGGILVGFKRDITGLRGDVNAIGRKYNEASALQQKKNDVIASVIVATIDDRTERLKVCELLKD